jgi:CheY-like chemotaxis protein
MKACLLKKLEDLHVLVVEDEAIIAMLIEDTLLDIGCKSVEVAPSIDRALEFLSVREPDFAILDLNLHGSRSYPVADALQVQGRPFVFLSGYGAKGLDGDYKDAPVLQKPFQQIDLEKALQRAILQTAPAS